MLTWPSRPQTPNRDKLFTLSWRDIPAPLPKQGPRSLTPPLSDDATSLPRSVNIGGMLRLFAKQLQRAILHIQSAFEQQQSPLLRLPLELRLMIWKQYLDAE